METRIIIRAKAEDAKFIGTSMGGALVIVKDALSGAILDQGLILGSTGDTKRLITTPWVRGERLSDENTACFVARLDLEEPRLVEIIVHAPYGQPQALARASITTWVVPGKHIEGDGIVVDFPGLVVRITEPTAHSFVAVPAEIRLAASVTPMCGCPVDMRTFWPPDAYEVGAYLKKNGEKLKTLSLPFGGSRNCFETRVSLDGPGDYELIVYAFDPQTGNTGVDKTTVVATR